MLASEALRRAAKVGGRVSLQNVRLWRADIDQDHDAATDAPLDVEVDIEAGHALDDHDLLVEVRYRVRAVAPESATAGRGYRISSSWRLSYRLASTDGLDADDYMSFASVSGVFAAHPYQRELVHRLSAQMGFPGLVLNVLQSPTDIRAGEDFELGADESAFPADG